MTITIKSEHVGDYIIEISQNKFSSAYDVSALEKNGSQWYAINKNTYPTIEDAKKRFSYLKSQAKKGYVPSSTIW